MHAGLYTLARENLTREDEHGELASHVVHRRVVQGGFEGFEAAVLEEALHGVPYQRPANGASLKGGSAYRVKRRVKVRAAKAIANEVRPRTCLLV